AILRTLADAVRTRRVSSRQLRAVRRRNCGVMPDRLPWSRATVNLPEYQSTTTSRSNATQRHSTEEQPTSVDHSIDIMDPAAAPGSAWPGRDGLLWPVPLTHSHGAAASIRGLSTR